MNIIYDAQFFYYCIWAVATVLFIVVLPVIAWIRGAIYVSFSFVVATQILLTYNSIESAYVDYAGTVSSTILASVFIKNIFVTLIFFNLISITILWIKRRGVLDF